VVLLYQPLYLVTMSWRTGTLPLTGVAFYAMVVLVNPESVWCRKIYPWRTQFGHLALDLSLIFEPRFSIKVRKAKHQAVNCSARHFLLLAATLPLSG